MGSLQGQNVVVVGGSRGVGRSIAEAALDEGATVLAVARGEQALAQFAREAPGVKTLAVDAAADSTPDEVFAALEPDVLVIAAGALAPAAPVHELSWEAFSVNWETDVKASFLFCKAALRRPLKPGSRVVLISSGAAFSGGPPFCGGYAGAKRMQIILAGYCQKESDRLGLDLRFMDLSPMRIMPEHRRRQGRRRRLCGLFRHPARGLHRGPDRHANAGRCGQGGGHPRHREIARPFLHGERERTCAGRLRRA